MARFEVVQFRCTPPVLEMLKEIQEAHSKGFSVRSSLIEMMNPKTGEKMPTYVAKIYNSIPGMLPAISNKIEVLARRQSILEKMLAEQIEEPNFEGK